MVVAHGHLFNRRLEEAKWAALLPFEGRTVTVSIGFRFTNVVTGTLAMGPGGRSVTLVSDRRRVVPLGEVHALVDERTGRQMRL